MPDPIADAVQGAATAWLTKQRVDLDALTPDDPALHAAVAAETGLEPADVYEVIARSWPRIAENVEQNSKVGGALGGRLAAHSFAKSHVDHPKFDGVRIVKLDDTSWISESIAYRSHATDRKGRTYGTPRNPSVPPISAFKPRFWDVRADQLETLIQERQHGLFPDQVESTETRNNQALLALDTDDPITALAVDGGISLTGGHHRTAEIIERVKDGRLAADSPVRILVHD